MATYALKSDKLFIRCSDMGAIKVYELDNPCSYPVKEEHWIQHGVTIGLGNECEALEIEDKEISGTELQTLIKDLFKLRLTVNREGLCFLSNTGTVQYYRLFDLFDWSKYQVRTSVNTKWTRMHILQCNEAEQTGEDDDRKQEKLREISHMQSMQRPLPPSCITFSIHNHRIGRPFRSANLVLRPVAAVESFPKIRIACAILPNRSMKFEFDVTHWQVAKFAYSHLSSFHHVRAYYTGNRHYYPDKGVRIPCPPYNLGLYDIDVIEVVGVGTCATIAYYDPEDWENCS